MFRVVFLDVDRFGGSRMVCVGGSGEESSGYVLEVCGISEEASRNTNGEGSGFCRERSCSKTHNLYCRKL